MLQSLIFNLVLDYFSMQRFVLVCSLHMEIQSIKLCFLFFNVQLNTLFLFASL
jgi:hypothetical protein